MRLLIAAFMAALFFVLSSVPSVAQRMPCGDGDGLIAHLEKEWGEAPAFIALDAAGRMVRILVNPDTGTWSMLVTGAGQPTCMISHGTDWEQIAPPTVPGVPS